MAIYTSMKQFNNKERKQNFENFESAHFGVLFLDNVVGCRYKRPD